MRRALLILALACGACGGGGDDDGSAPPGDATTACTDLCSCMVATCLSPGDGRTYELCLDSCGDLTEQQITCRTSMCLSAGDQDSIQCQSARGETTCPVTMATGTAR